MAEAPEDVVVRFTGDAARRIRRLAEQQGGDPTDCNGVVGKAVVVLEALNDEVWSGAKIVLEKNRGRTRTEFSLVDIPLLPRKQTVFTAWVSTRPVLFYWFVLTIWLPLVIVLTMFFMSWWGVKSEAYSRFATTAVWVGSILAAVLALILHMANRREVAKPKRANGERSQG